MRYLLALAMGVVVTLGIFFLISSLIHQEEQEKRFTINDHQVDFIRKKVSSETRTRARVVPKQPANPDQPPLVPTISTANEDPSKTRDAEFTVPDISSSLKGGAGPYLAARSSPKQREAMPIIRVEPQYPPQAIRRGIEGYVTLNYTVTINGSIADIKIISADPPRIFNKAATRALLKWKYKPKVVDGKAVPYNQSTTLDFIIKK